MKNRRVILLNIFIIIIVVLMKKNLIMDDVIKYITFDTEGCNFKDLLSISATILAIFLGFIATAITVIISMCDKRIMKLVKEFGKTAILYRSMKASVLYGLISLIGIAIMYINADFNIILLRAFIIWIVINSLYIFLCHSRFLVIFINEIIKQIFFSNEELVVGIQSKKK